MKTLRKIHLLEIILLIFFLSSCQLIEFKKKDIDLEQVNEGIKAKNYDSLTFNEYLKAKKLENEDYWRSDSMIAALYFFNPQIKTAEKNYQAIRTNEIIAKFRPQSSVGIEFGSENNANNGASMVNALFPLETANKRMIRYEIALNESQSAYEEYRLTIWNERLKLVDNLVQYAFQIKKIQSIKNELVSRHNLLTMSKKRYESGVFEQAEYHQKKLEFQTTQNLLTNAQLKQASLRSEIAKNIGISLEIFEKKPILVEEIILNLIDHIKSFDNNDMHTQWRDDALLSRIDLRKLLADYAVSEGRLKYEIASQYPDLQFNPAYIYDTASKIWILGISSLIPNLAKNRALINKAEKIRDVEGSKIDSLQLQLNNDSLSIMAKLSQANEKFKNTVSLLEEKNQLKYSLDAKYNNGILSRYEFEIENIKLYEIDYLYLDNLYNLLSTAYEIEKVYQRPFVSQLNFEKEPNE